MDITITFSDDATTEAVLTHWLFNSGSFVRSGQVIAEAMLDKVSLEVVAPIDGYLSIIVTDDQAFHSGDTVAVIGDQPQPSPTSMEQSEDLGAHDPKEFVPVTPAVRRFAKDRNIDLSAVQSAYPNQKLSIRLLEEWIQKPSSGSKIPWDTFRRTLIDNLRNPGAIPFTVHRKLVWPHSLEEHGLVLPVVCHAVQKSLGTHPRLHGWIDDEGFVQAPELAMGIAVSREQKLFVHTISPAPESFSAWQTALAQIKKGNLNLTHRPSFTVSNLGPWGIEYFTPVLSAPGVAILGVGALQADGLPVSLTVDHRWVDGVDAAQFLMEVSSQIMTIPAKK